jgi:acyl-CoA reductase-like NAD-dependent aldehyde dehydrogenase
VSARLTIPKTLKLYVGGAFIRSESGRVDTITSRAGEAMYVARASRKDLRDAIATARAAQPGWSGRTPYNRGQILYRLAEMMEGRRDLAPAELLGAAVDRCVHHAGWTDKLGAVLSSVNPVSHGYVNYSKTRPIGVVVALPDPADGLLGLVEATVTPLLTGNAVLVVVPAALGETAAAFAEALHTSDVPAGTVALLTGDVPEILDTVDKHDDVDLVLVSRGALSPARLQAAEEAGARTLRRHVVVAGAASPASPDVLARLLEVQTVWMSA